MQHMRPYTSESRREGVWVGSVKEGFLQDKMHDFSVVGYEIIF